MWTSVEKLAGKRSPGDICVELHWSSEALAQVLAQRFRAAARPDLRTLNDLARPDWMPPAVSRAAPLNLPRTLLAAASELLDG